jgi:hypothetical protein
MQVIINKSIIYKEKYKPASAFDYFLARLMDFQDINKGLSCYEISNYTKYLAQSYSALYSSNIVNI